MYNLEVEELHTYYVTDDRVLVHNEYGNSQDKVNEAIKNIPEKDKQLGECDGFAEKLSALLKKAGIDFDIIRIDSDFNIYSDKAGTVIGRKYHYGIRVGDTVYDNLTTIGMSFDDWLDDMGFNEVGGLYWNVVDEIINH